MKSILPSSLTFAAALLAASVSLAAEQTIALKTADSDNNTVSPATSQWAQNTYSRREILSEGHAFFGTTTKGIARAIEYIFSQAGRPSGYIIGQEGAGAFIGGLRYGEGTLFLKNGGSQKVFWQGPSVGFDFGGNGSRTLVLVYDIDRTTDIFDRFVGVEGSAYLVGGVGVNFQSNDKLKLAPIRTGVGARFGANFGYLKYTSIPTWNPF